MLEACGAAVENLGEMRRKLIPVPEELRVAAVEAREHGMPDLPSYCGGSPGKSTPSSWRSTLRPITQEDQRPRDQTSTSGRRTWLLLTFVIEPWLRRSPEERSEGTRPTKPMNSSGGRQRTPNQRPGTA
jgi:hypothetical protein